MHENFLAGRGVVVFLRYMFSFLFGLLTMFHCLQGTKSLLLTGNTSSVNQVTLLFLCSLKFRYFLHKSLSVFTRLCHMNTVHSRAFVFL